MNFFNSLIGQLTVELTVGFVLLLISVRLIGNRQLSQITPFDFISALVLGELVGNAIYDPKTPFYYIIYSVTIWTILMLLIEKITLKSLKARKIIQGAPEFVVRDGLINFDVLIKQKLDFTEFLGLLRDKNAFSIREVDYAILENSGVITVKKKSAFTSQNNNSEDDTKSSINLPVILDGQIVDDHLKTLNNRSREWLMKLLQQRDITNVKTVLYAEWSEQYGFHLQKYDDYPKN
ncbi:DUF421 domain-containing protein [Haloplasma contractile]|uniref:Transmembrane protein YetF n=1 Tax=Haloplasma contractile SSD-17B TaxID=1033810 RepID=U2FGC5_9MOLU|nr:DUF421 domain-containing protein [Haloplasma contractile]ERJ11930.1 transmembrane protein YetF [Haloplasma contractile SSD-17B]